MKFLQGIIMTTIILFYSVANSRFEKHFRFSDLQSIYYSSFHEKESNMNLSCAIFQFTPVSDFTLLYEISITSTTSTTPPLLTLYKGEMRKMLEVDIMNCFRLQPPVLGMQTFCIREMGVMSNSYLIITNVTGDFVYGLVHIPHKDEEILLSRLLLYNTSTVQKENCGFNPLLL
jgi:hypothetical protein